MLVPLWLLLSFSTVSASPVHLADTAGGSACLAVLLTLFLLLSCLLIGKRIFLKTRKSEHPSPCSIAADISARSSTSILPSAADHGNARAAFLVGFFGSPAWETSVANLVDKSTYPEYQQSSIGSRIRTSSHRSKYSRTPNSSLTSKGSVVDHSTSRSISVSTVGDIRALYELRDPTALGRQRKSRSLRLLTRPPKAYTGSLTPRRFSMPAVGRRDVNNVGHRKRTSSLKSSVTRRSDLSSSSFPGHSSLRLVESTDSPDYPLPLSPKQSEHYISTSSNAFATSDSNFKHDHTPISPIPPIPPLPVLRSTSTPEHPIQTKNSLRISHPYPLSPGSNSSVVVNKGAPRTGQSAVHLASSAKTERQDPINTRKPLSPALTSINLSPLSVPFPPTTYPMELPSCPPEKPIISPKVKQKAGRSSIRIRRSPTIGPSPLRAMILPDPSDPSITVRTSVSQMGSRNSNTTLDYSRLGLGYPSTFHTAAHDSDLKNTVAAMPEQVHDQTDRASGATEDGDDPNVIISIIRELVEETSQWDKSLFKDKNFKTMIDNSKYPSFKGGNQIRGSAVKEDSSSLGISDDKSAEFDLSLLGLDIFRSNGETFIPGSEDKWPLSEKEGADMVSFWEDKGWDDQDSRRDLIYRDSVGVAC